jgi:hypothetical protein
MIPAAEYLLNLPCVALLYTIILGDSLSSIFVCFINRGEKTHDKNEQESDGVVLNITSKV